MTFLTKAQVAYHLQEFAGSPAQWYINSWCAFPRTDQGQHAALVVCEGRRTLGYWPLLPVTHDSLLRQLQRPTPSSYPIPAVPGFSYHDELIPLLHNWARSLAEQSVPVLNRVLQLYYHLEDTPGVPLAAATSWWEQADALLRAFNSQRLQALLHRVGRPRYREHASELRTSLQQAQQALLKLVAFVQQVPYPTSLPKPLPQARSPLYPALAQTPVGILPATPTQALTTGQHRRFYCRYYLRDTDFGYQYLDA